MRSPCSPVIDNFCPVEFCPVYLVPSRPSAPGSRRMWDIRITVFSYMAKLAHNDTEHSD